MQFRDRSEIESRVSLMRVGAIVGFLGLLFAFWILQIARHQEFREIAANNLLRTVSLRAPRGMVFDRDGHALIQSRYAFNILLVREQSDDVEASVVRIAAATGCESNPTPSIRSKGEGSSTSASHGVGSPANACMAARTPSPSGCVASTTRTSIWYGSVQPAAS